MAYVEYSSNNSGGSWWLKDKDWKALEEAGWVVEWASLTPEFSKKGNYIRDKYGIPKLIHVEKSKHKTWADKDEKGEYRWLGALAKRAYKPDCDSIRAAAEEWEKTIGQCATDAGCPCCGQPHNFIAYDDKGKVLASGPHTEYSASWDD